MVKMHRTRETNATRGRFKTLCEKSIQHKLVVHSMEEMLALRKQDGENVSGIDNVCEHCWSVSYYEMQRSL